LATPSTSAAKARSEDTILPVIKNGEHARVRKIKVLEKKTRPPVPYTEATLLADMEGAAKFVEDPTFKKVLKRTTGLGTPATQASIIEGLKASGMLYAEKKHILASDKGVALIDWLPPECYDVVRTARWETELALIEKTGEDFHFLQAMRTDTARIVGLLKLRGPMSTIPASVAATASTVGSGGGADPSGPPTEKMLSYAESLAVRLAVKLPKEVKTDFVACRKFIDEHANEAPPSPKALAYADSIAKAKGVALPEAARKSAKKLSAWIDSNK
jgi:DNA topoisomerase-3